MKRYILFALFCFVAGSAFGQYPANPNKIRLGNQTSGDGLVYRGSGAPAYTPTDAKNAWVYIDSVAGRMYTYRGGAWEFVSAGAGVDSLAYRNDSLFVYSPDTTFYVVIDRTFTIAGSAGTPQAVDPGQTVTISNGFGITTTAAATRTVEVKSDTAAIATKTYTTNALALKLNLSDTATMLAPYQRDISLTTTGTSGAATFSSNVLNIPQYQAALTNPVTGTGTSGKVAKFTGTSSIGNGIASDDGTRFSLDDASTSTAKPFDFDSWTTAARPAVPMAGDAGWNTSNTNLDLYSGSAWENPVKSATATGLGTVGRVFYADANGRAAADDVIRWDASNDRLGIGTSSPSQTLHVVGKTIIGVGLGTGAIFEASGDSPTAAFFRGSNNTNIILRAGLAGYSAGFNIQDSAGSTTTSRIESNTGTGLLKLSSTGDISLMPTSSVGIGNTTPSRTLHVTGEVRITDLTTDTPTRIVGADADGDLGEIRFGSEIGRKTGDTLAILQQGATSGQALAWNGSNWRPTTISASVSDGDKGDITVSSSGTVWNIDADVIGTTELADGAVATANLATGAVTGAVYGTVYYVPVDSINYDATTDLATYSEIHYYMYTGAGATANQVLTVPAASSTYAGKKIYVVSDDADQLDAYGLAVTSSSGATIRYYSGGDTGFSDNNSYASFGHGEGPNAVLFVCMQNPRTLAYRWVAYDGIRGGY